MSALPVLLVSLSIALAACGGEGKRVASARSPGGEGDDPATPFDDAAVKAAITDSSGVAACGADPASTMGVHFAAQRAALKGDDGSTPVNETFRCRARADDRWDCEWALFTAPAAATAPAEVGEGEVGGEGSGFLIMFTVGSDGRVDRGSIACNAPG